MAKKEETIICNVKYYAPANLSIKIGEKQIHFMTGWSNSYYICTDNEERKALESHKWFGEKFFLERDDSTTSAPVSKKATKKAKEETNSITEVDVATWQEASEYLKEKFGEEANDAMTPPSILQFAEAHNVKFTKLG